MNKSNPIIVYAPDKKGRVNIPNGSKKHHYVLKCNFSLKEQRAFVERLQSIVHVESFSNIATNRMSLGMIAYSRIKRHPMKKDDLKDMISDLLCTNYKF